MKNVKPMEDQMLFLAALKINPNPWLKYKYLWVQEEPLRL